MDIFDNVSWRIPEDDVRFFLNDNLVDFLEMPQEFLNNWTQNRFFPASFSITYPIDRYEEYDPVTENYRFPRQLAAADVLSVIQYFYQTHISQDDIASQPENPQYDTLIYQQEQGIPITRADLLGGANFFEGLRPIRNGDRSAFYLNLGS